MADRLPDCCVFGGGHVFPEGYFADIYEVGARSYSAQ